MVAKRTVQPIDKIAIALIICFALVMLGLVWGNRVCGSQCIFSPGAKVRDFSWQNKTIGSEDRAFILTFNRPMNRTSVEQNLAITPPLSGKFSWSGLRLAYTLEKPVPYGKTYHLSLTGATDRYTHQGESKSIQPYEAKFRSRDRVFAYIGTQGEEKDRLILYNRTKQQKKILTPKNLNVFDFHPYPQGERLLFSAADTQLGLEGIQRLKLYRVTTGLNFPKAKNINPQVELVLDNQKYQNNKFDLAQDGKTIVVQRLERDNPTNYGLWKIIANQPPQLITNAQVGDFLITPDSQTVATAQGEGIALFPLENGDKPIDFIPKFGQVLDFTADGIGAAMIDFNTDNAELRYKRSLFYLDNQGRQKELVNTEGSIQNCQFTPDATHLYCWLTKLEKGEEYIEKPYLAEINLQTGKTKTLVSLAKYQDNRVSIAPDGLEILFERGAEVSFPSQSSDNYSLVTNSPETFNKSIWLLKLPSQKDSIQQLPFVGFRPQWLP